MNDLTLRPISGAGELGLFSRLPYVLNGELAADLAAGRRRPEWMWVALRGDELVARVAWWARAAGDAPMFLDILDLAAGEDAGTGVRLLETAGAAVLPEGTRRPGYTRFVPPDWREDAAVREGVEERMRIVERTGGRLFVERLRLEWRRGTPVPEPAGRLAFRGVRDRAELVGLMTQVLDGTLDAHSRDDLTRMTAAQAAEQQYDEELERYASPREWWRVATLPDGGEPVGFVIPARNAYHPIIAYLAVLPAHRGKGFIDDVLAEGTRVLAAQDEADVPRIRASTDVGNVPMANAFHRAGYVTHECQIDMVWPDPRA
ncbi:GNAT family N-acetyltransferase [Streptomyces sp. NPDC020983]|uniref:GNAT family N-acetyltransferase n=1 Tax=Streptomyces sp. NPDC020983 TaxID=3365106 RepID=UPI0037919766